MGNREEGVNDDSRMPFGKHKGSKLSNVPAPYLLWLADELGKEPKDAVRAELRAYVDENRAVLEQESESERGDGED